MRKNECVFNNNSRWKPDVYKGIFPDCSPLQTPQQSYKKSGCESHIHRKVIIELVQNEINKGEQVYGGAGFFGEVRGPCGWKEEKKYDCCFSKCRPMWKTRLWPLKVSL
jgi:hypothetical protein